jgi:acyl-CoA dehydrogenase
MRLEPGVPYQALRSRVRELAESTVRRHAAEVDRDHRFPHEAIRAAGESELMGILLPPEHGGAGLDHLAFTICVEELARACASTAVIVDVHNSVASEPILLFGTDEQRRAWLPRLASGEVLGAFALTEPGSGSDAASLATTARRAGQEWVLTGRKVFITNIGEAGLYIVFARTGPEPRAAGVSAFLVPGDAEGVRVGQVFRKMGLNGSPMVEHLGRPAEAGRPAGPGQGAEFLLADMATRLTAARQMAYHAAVLCAGGKPFTREASMAKLFCTDAAMDIATDAVQLAGEVGGLRDHPFERHFRDAKALQIYEGSNQVQRVVIARHLLAAS